MVRFAIVRLAPVVFTLTSCTTLAHMRGEIDVKVTCDQPGVDVYVPFGGGPLVHCGRAPCVVWYKGPGVSKLVLVKDSERTIVNIEFSGSCERHIKWLGSKPAPINDNERRVFERKIAIGMTSEQVMWSWGPPSKRNTTTTGGGTHEQWIYGNPLSKAQYVYFDNGVLTTIQESK